MRVGKRQILALALQTHAPIALAMLKLRFDSKMFAVHGVKEGGLLSNASAAPRLLHSINPAGSITVSVTPAASAMLTGAGILVFVEVEALQVGNGSIYFDENMARLISGDGSVVPVRLTHGSLVVK
ncbi:MAG: hypothetical protein WKF30_06715 [Pyrinomonadaceae bacterium]